MRIYKYRKVTPGNAEEMLRLKSLILSGRVWCARPDTLNDPDEFAWTCDYSETPDTAGLLASLLEEIRGRPGSQAFQMARVLLDGRDLESVVAPIITDTIRRCRDIVGIACFGTSPDNETLWQRYAGDGSGVCVEIDVPDALLGAQLHRVVYSDNRQLHIDGFIRARNELDYAAGHFATLLSKSLTWAPEEEVRFLSNTQNIEVLLDGSRVTCVILGPHIPAAISDQVRQVVGGIPVKRAMI